MNTAIDLRGYASRAEALHSLGLRGFVSAVVRGFQRPIAAQGGREAPAARAPLSPPAAMRGAAMRGSGA